MHEGKRRARAKKAGATKTVKKAATKPTRKPAKKAKKA
jgi:hypothetical protein